jgi:hypothetical protein
VLAEPQEKQQLYVDLPMDETELVDSFDGKRDLSHVESSDILGKDFVLDKHSHEIASGQELHEHVEERVVLKRSVQLDNPRTV